MIEGAVIADLGGLADHDAHAVVNEQTAADRGARMDLDPRRHPSDMRDKAARKIPATHPQPMRHAVEEQCLEAGITQHDFKARPGRGIARKRCVNLVAQVFEKHRRHYVIVGTFGGPTRKRGSAKVEQAYNCPTQAIKYVHCDAVGGHVGHCHIPEQASRI